MINSVQLPGIFTNMEISPNYLRIIAWTEQSIVQLVEATTLSLLDSYTPINIPPGMSTKSVAFSLDSSMVILETDTFNPIVVLNTTDLSEVHSIPVSQSIFSAHFINSSNELVIVFGQNTTFVVNLTSGTQY